jgi:signal peptidase I
MADFHNSLLGEEEESKSFLGFLLTIVVMFAIFFGLRSFVTSNFSGVIVDGASMQQTLYDGEKLLMRRFNEQLELERGDIIVVKKSNLEKEEYIIKRLIGKSGDKLYCQQGTIYICYQGTEEYVQLDEPYAYYYKNKNDYSFASRENPYVVAENGIFYLGDNRQNSQDSQEEYDSPMGVLYQTTDIYGVVEDWALAYQKPLEWIFF